VSLAKVPISQGQSREPRAVSREPRAVSREPRAESREYRAGGKRRAFAVPGALVYIPAHAEEIPLMNRPRLGGVALLVTALAAAFTTRLLTRVAAQPSRIDPALYSGLRWRSIGPFRAGRVNGVSGVPGQPNVFSAGSVGGGVWKTTNAGRSWSPIFYSQPIASIGAIAVAASNPNVLYVGTGEADMRSQISYGNGVYKSTDAGRSWTHIGLDNTRQIGKVIIHPQNPDVVFVAALGH